MNVLRSGLFVFASTLRLCLVDLGPLGLGTHDGGGSTILLQEETYGVSSCACT